MRPQFSISNIIEYIGYIVEFPNPEGEDSVMALGFNRLNIASPRSAIRRNNNFYMPYSLLHSKRPSISEDVNLKPVRSQIKTAPKRLMLADETPARTVNSMISEKPWATLISKTAGYPNVNLSERVTSLGEIVDFVDTHTGERARQYRACPFLRPTDHV